MAKLTRFDGAVLGALAGFSATLIMTSAMQRMHERLPRRERYPLTPRQIVETKAALVPRRALASATLVAHFIYGGGTGAIFGALMRRPSLCAGMIFGAGVWGASYLGWLPALGILTPAARHPPRRNALMLAAHLLWGAATAIGVVELARAHRGGFSGGKLRDASPRSSFPTAPGRGRPGPRHRR
jgi:hypothetical protein